MKLTPEQRLQVFMLYPNAEVLHRLHKEKVLGYDTSRGLVILDVPKTIHQFEANPKDCQLLLRSINDITEEEKRELAKVLGGEERDYKVSIDRGLIKLYRETILGYSVDGEYMMEELPYSAADYLRSKNIALPYMGVDLFEEGIATQPKTN